MSSPAPEALQPHRIMQAVVNTTRLLRRFGGYGCWPLGPLHEANER